MGHKTVFSHKEDYTETLLFNIYFMFRSRLEKIQY